MANIKYVVDITPEMDAMALQNAVNEISVAIQKENEALVKQRDLLQQVKSQFEGVGATQSTSYKLILSQLQGVNNQLDDTWDGAASSVNDYNKSLQTTEQSQKSFVDSLATFGLAINAIQQVSQEIGNLLSISSDLGKQVSFIGTLGAKNFKEMREPIVQLSKEIPFMADEIARAVYNGADVVDGMIDIGESMAYVEQNSKLAVASMSDLGVTTEVLNATMKAYKADASEIAEYTDVLAYAFTKANLPMEQLNGQIGGLAGSAHQMGVDFKEVMALMVELRLSGTSTAESVTQLNAIMQSFQAPGKKLKDVMDATGVSLGSIKTEGLTSELAKIEEYAAKTGTNLTAIMGRLEASQGAMKLVGGNLESTLEQIQNFSENSAGAVESSFATMADDASVKSQIIQNQLDSLVIGFTDMLGTEAVTVLDFLNQIAPRVITFSQLGDSMGKMFSGIKDAVVGLPETFTSVLGTMDSINRVGSTTMGNLVGTINDADKGILKLLKNSKIWTMFMNSSLAKMIFATNAETVALKAQGIAGATSGTQIATGMTAAGTAGAAAGTATSSAFGPVTLIALAVGGLVIAFKLLYSNVEPFRVAMDAIWEAIKEGAKLLGEWVKLAINIMTAFNPITLIFRVIWDVIGKIRERISDTEGGSNMLANAAKSVGEWFAKVATIVSNISGYISEAVSFMGDLVIGALEFLGILDKKKPKMKVDVDTTDADKKIKASNNNTKNEIEQNFKYYADSFRKFNKELGKEKGKEKAQKELEELGKSTTEIGKKNAAIAKAAFDEVYKGNKKGAKETTQAIKDLTNEFAKLKQNIQDIEFNISISGFDEVEQKIAKIGYDYDKFAQEIEARKIEIQVELSDLEQIKKYQDAVKGVNVALTASQKLQFAWLQDEAKKTGKTAQEILETSIKQRKDGIDVISKYEALKAGEVSTQIKDIRIEESLKVYTKDREEIAKIREEAQNSVNDFKRLQAELIIDDGARKLALSIIDAEDEYNKDIQTLNKYYENIAKSYAASNMDFEEYNAAMVQLDARYLEFKESIDTRKQSNLNKSNADAKASYSQYVEIVRNAYSDIDKIVAEKAKDISGRKGELTAEENALKTSYMNREITAREYYSKIGEFAKESAALQQEQNKLIWGTFSETAARAFDEMAQKGYDSFSELAKDAQNFDDVSKVAWTQLGIASGAAFANMVISGESGFKAILQLTLDALKAMIPIFIAEQFGSSTGSFSLAGIAIAAGLTAGLYALVSVAETAIAGFYTGGVDIRQGNPSEKDGMPAFINYGESVITTDATRAYGNADVFRELNKTGGSVYKIMGRPQNIDMLVKTWGGKEINVLFSQPKIKKEIETRVNELAKSRIDRQIAIYTKTVDVEYWKELNAEQKRHTQEQKITNSILANINKKLDFMQAEQIATKEELQQMKDTRLFTEVKVKSDIHVHDDRKRIKAEQYQALYRG